MHRAGFLLTAVGLALFAVMPVAAAQEAETGSIEGRAYDAASGEPACVNVEIKDVDTGSVSDDRVAADGTYRIEVSVGFKTVRFYDSCGFVYADQWWNAKSDAASADIVEVVTGAVVSNVDAAMAPPVDEGGWVSGIVTDVDGNPVEGICVTPFGEDGEIYLGEGALSGRTATDGTYRIGFLGSAVLRVQFVDCGPFVWKTQWWNGRGDFASADPVTVTLGAEVANVDATLELQEGAVAPTTAPEATLPMTGTYDRLSILALAGAVLILVGFTVLRRARRG